jgi:hypothetical protein
VPPLAPVPAGPHAVESFAAILREEQCRLGGDGLILTDTALEAALRRTRVQTVAAPAAAGAATSSDTPANAPATDERHRRAWGKLVLSVFNEAAQANVTQRLPLAPPGVPPSSPPAALLAHRQARAQEIALDKLKKFGTTSSRVAGVPFHEEGHAAIAKDPFHEEGHAAIAKYDIDDIAELDGLVRSSLRSHEDEIQVQLSDELLRRMVREVVEEHQRIAERRRA